MNIIQYVADRRILLNNHIAVFRTSVQEQQQSTNQIGHRKRVFMFDINHFIRNIPEFHWTKQVGNRIKTFQHLIDSLFGKILP
ncbi:hypothetical protein SDC9_189704 [bioreactor metagenome]|uniref:Uncharacterized protein n=1 Tax=bioreactor metagenome TaxID=1076179 RepID=A0A645HSX1_9ZZZZ